MQGGRDERATTRASGAVRVGVRAWASRRRVTQSSRALAQRAAASSRCRRSARGISPTNLVVDAPRRLHRPVRRAYTRHPTSTTLEAATREALPRHQATPLLFPAPVLLRPANTTRAHADEHAQTTRSDAQSTPVLAAATCDVSSLFYRWTPPSRLQATPPTSPQVSCARCVDECAFKDTLCRMQAPKRRPAACDRTLTRSRIAVQTAALSAKARTTRWRPTPTRAQSLTETRLATRE